ncbi:MAG: hypothetical protein Ta2G_12600 [Termitinemataceae bacterium]|nr:MAG: hypothetical protein Ta2G_12600 [Termitinemataceae bacterium]
MKMNTYGLKDIVVKIGTKYMKRIYIFFILLFLISNTVFAQRKNIEKSSPLNGFEFNEWRVTLNGRTFTKNEYAQSWDEQSGNAVINGRKFFYWLYDTVTYRGGKADAIYNNILPSWIEELGYVIDYDNIRVVNPNSSLASSVKALMQQRGCDISVTITTGPIGPVEGPDIDYLIVNEYFKSKGTYKTTIYPLLLFY